MAAPTRREKQQGFPPGLEFLTIQHGRPQKARRQMIELVGLLVDVGDQFGLQLRQTTEGEKAGTGRPCDGQGRLELVCQRVQHSRAQLFRLAGRLGVGLSLQGAHAFQRDSAQRCEGGSSELGHSGTVQRQTAYRPRAQAQHAKPGSRDGS